HRGDRPDPHELCPDHPAGRLHRACGQPAAGDPGYGDEAMSESKPTAADEEFAEQPEVEEAPDAPPAPTAAEHQELKDRLLRTLAEMENLRTRTQREVEEARKFAVTGFARDLLEGGDNLGRALASGPAQAR